VNTFYRNFLELIKNKLNLIFKRKNGINTYSEGLNDIIPQKNTLKDLL